VLGQRYDAYGTYSLTIENNTGKGDDYFGSSPPSAMKIQYLLAKDSYEIVFFVITYSTPSSKRDIHKYSTVQKKLKAIPNQY